ncbi:MAG TPA: hypothetical protein PLZ36_04850 [Armatimonadota bacterium]|nr:hypothetical protein [Armatimonadota bacterium]HOS43755.1 hypothetical protein [Armatimonadota bacterium]
MMALHLDRGSVDLQYTDMDLRQALGDLALLTGVTVNIYPEVQGTVTVDLHHASLAQALDVLLGGAYTYTVGPHEVIYIHRAGTAWQPGNEHIP